MSLIINIEFKRVFIISLLTFLILFGILSNIINIYVFSHRSMRNVSVFRFLLYLSLVDLLVVLICMGDLYLVYGFSIEIKLYSTINNYRKMIIFPIVGTTWNLNILKLLKQIHSLHLNYLMESEIKLWYFSGFVLLKWIKNRIWIKF